MNCTQAQVLLAAHRELKNSEAEALELEAHLEQCSSCREMLARYSFIGEQLRSLPPMQPPAEMHFKLMSALAAEHAQFIQKSAAASPPPEFLKPYLREHAQLSHKTDSFAAFSRADTGPLPVLRTSSIPTESTQPNWGNKLASRAHQKGRRLHVGQFTVIGLAAVFFIVVLMGGLTSLLLLAHDNLPESSGAIVINPPIEVTSAKYTTSTDYMHVVSAVADRTSIYYSAYGDGSSSGWMLEQLDRTTKISTPLLATPSTNPLIVLGSANGWLVWLQLDAPKITTRTILHHELHFLVQSWSLHSLSLVTQQQDGILVPPMPDTITSGTFDQETVPDWIHTPVQGTWFVQNSLLVAMIDRSGISHLMSYPLNPKSIFPATEIAKAAPGHIFTSPTANSDGTKMYWSDEWRTDDDNLHSNIWVQQVFDTPHTTIRHAEQQTITEKQLFLSGGMSFRPLMVGDNLFLLSTANGADIAQGTPGTTPTATPTSTAAPTATPNTTATTPAISWADTSVYAAALDNNIRGTLLMFPAGDALNTPPTIMNTIGPASSLQAGTNFVLWQNGNGSYGMFDATTRTNVTVGDILNGAQFLAVNGDAAVWTINNTDNTVQATPSAVANASATLMAFNWPGR